MALLDLRTRTFPLPALAAEVARWSSAMGGASLDERVSATPDERTLRYYQSLGVLDRPLRYEGRQAVYGYRHLLQALATKALQGQGLSLSQVQAALLGVADVELEQAVLDALGGGSAPVAGRPTEPPAAASPVPTRPWCTYELAPGLLVVLDPARFPDPEAVASALRGALPLVPPSLPGKKP